ncbi:hypothetical protein ACQPZX_38885 [Actinoplanes sp. CA-142083]|uniref:hypothetical protein n=1 Tax=Actinoplanes sp. CA-142083 TaxID=3239903 RepID=UPI003D8C0A4A
MNARLRRTFGQHDVDALGEMLGRLETFYQARGEHDYGNELVPHMWSDGTVNLSAAGPTAWARPRLESMRHILLYAHGVELSDPLPETLRRVIGCLDEGRSPISHTSTLREAVRMWQDIAGLVGDGTVTTVPWRPAQRGASGTAHYVGAALIEEVAADWRFRADYFRISLRIDPSSKDDVAEWVVKEPGSPAMNDAAVKAFMESYLVDTYLMIPNYLASGLEHVLHSQSLGHGAAWFPDEDPFDLTCAVAAAKSTLDDPVALRGSWPERELVDMVARCDMPHLAELDLATLIALRRQDEVFEAWRERLREALRTYRPAGDPKSMLFFVDEMKDAAARLESEMRRTRSPIWTSISRRVGFAALGSAAGALTGGVAGVAVGGGASAVATGLDIAVEHRQGRRRLRESIDAACRTAIFMGSAPPG